MRNFYLDYIFIALVKVKYNFNFIVLVCYDFKSLGKDDISAEWTILGMAWGPYCTVPGQPRQNWIVRGLVIETANTVAKWKIITDYAFEYYHHIRFDTNTRQFCKEFNSVWLAKNQQYPNINSLKDGCHSDRNILHFQLIWGPSWSPSKAE